MIEFDDLNFNMKSSIQMQEFLFEFLHLVPEVQTKSGAYSVNEAVMTHFAEEKGIEFCKLLLNYRKLLKAKNTYLADIKRNVIDGLIHPEFWMNTTETFRSSSSNINFQNIPKHGDIVPEMPWKDIRKLFSRSKKGWLLGEVDYSGAETKTAAMISDDEQMITDLNNDMDQHSYWTSIIFGIKKSLEAIKKENEDERFLAKNNFTFANYFGASPESMAEEIRKLKVYKNHILSKFNISNSVSSWEEFYIDYSIKHITECQNAFYSRYPVFKAWQDSIVRFYYDNGYIENPFGFRRHAPLKRNEIINYPIQSTSFLLLLDSLIEADKKIRDAQMQSRLIGQIHDSGFFNLKVEEIFDVALLVNKCMIKKNQFAFTRKVKMETDWDIGINWKNMIRIPKDNLCL